MTRLSVNLNKIAVLRNSRGGESPSVEAAAHTVLAAGAHGITVHPRPDLRHIRPDDVRALASWLPVELNIEGNPFAPANAAGYPGLLALVAETSCAQCTLVPDGDAQLTSDHGFDLRGDARRLAPVVAKLKSLGTRVSVFVGSGAQDLSVAAELGIDRIEIYTGPYAHAHAQGHAAAELSRCAALARHAQTLGIAVNAGHDLNQRNLGEFLTAVPSVSEVSIGHALIAEALEVGLETTVRRYLSIITAATASS